MFWSRSYFCVKLFYYYRFKCVHFLYEDVVNQVWGPRQNASKTRPRQSVTRSCYMYVYRPAEACPRLFDGPTRVSGHSEQKEPVLTQKHHTLNHTNWAAAHSSRRRGWRRRASTAGAKSVATPPREFLLMTAGETGSKRSKFRARKRACTPVGSLGMEG